MIFREATIQDILQIQIVRNAVKENMLTSPDLVPNVDVEDYITRRGKGWVCVIDNMVVGFSIVSVMDHNIWALFVTPKYEEKKLASNYTI